MVHRLKSDKELRLSLSIIYLSLAEFHSYTDCDGESDDDSNIFSKVKLLPQKWKGFLASRKIEETMQLNSEISNCYNNDNGLLPFVQNR